MRVFTTSLAYWEYSLPARLAFSPSYLGSQLGTSFGWKTEENINMFYSVKCFAASTDALLPSVIILYPLPSHSLQPGKLKLFFNFWERGRNPGTQHEHQPVPSLIWVGADKGPAVSWQYFTIHSIHDNTHVCLPSRSWNSPQILSRFLCLCDIGVKYLKWSKLRELVAKILINCFKAVKFTEILTQHRCSLTVAGGSNSIYWLNLTGSVNQHCNVNSDDKSPGQLTGFRFWLHPQYCWIVGASYPTKCL